MATWFYLYTECINLGCLCCLVSLKWNVKNSNYCMITKGTTVVNMMFAQLENGICIDLGRQSKTIIKQTNKPTSEFIQQMSWSSGQFSTTGMHQISLCLHSVTFIGYRWYSSPPECVKNNQCFCPLCYSYCIVRQQSLLFVITMFLFGLHGFWFHFDIWFLFQKTHWSDEYELCYSIQIHYQVYPAEHCNK